MFTAIVLATIATLVAIVLVRRAEAAAERLAEQEQLQMRLLHY